MLSHQNDIKMAGCMRMTKGAKNSRKASRVCPVWSPDIVAACGYVRLQNLQLRPTTAFLVAQQLLWTPRLRGRERIVLFAASTCGGIQGCRVSMSNKDDIRSSCGHEVSPVHSKQKLICERVFLYQFFGMRKSKGV